MKEIAGMGVDRAAVAESIDPSLNRSG